MARSLLRAIPILFATTAIHGAGFDCTRAASPGEKTICADRNLSELDEHLSRYYAAARTGLNEGARCLQEDQRLWIARRNACRDAMCLERGYLDRLGELDALQPGASAIRNRELPRVPALVWIVPAAADNVAARPDPKAKPGEVVGTLLDEVATGDGYVLRADAGERHLVIPLMFLDGATASQLAVLAKNAGARYSARGHLVARDGRRDFDPARCVFIHRLVSQRPS